MSNPPVTTYRDLEVWQKSIDLAQRCYVMTSSFPREEAYGMTAQIRRASVSTAANIAEGHGREQTGSFIQFLRQAQGSLKELETHVIIAERVNLADPKRLAAVLESCGEIGRMLRGLIRSLQERQNRSASR